MAKVFFEFGEGGAGGEGLLLIERGLLEERQEVAVDADDVAEVVEQNGVMPGDAVGVDGLEQGGVGPRLMLHEIANQRKHVQILTPLAVYWRWYWLRMEAAFCFAWLWKVPGMPAQS